MKILLTILLALSLISLASASAINVIPASSTFSGIQPGETFCENLTIQVHENVTVWINATANVNMTYNVSNPNFINDSEIIPICYTLTNDAAPGAFQITVEASADMNYTELVVSTGSSGASTSIYCKLSNGSVAYTPLCFQKNTPAPGKNNVSVNNTPSSQDHLQSIDNATQKISAAANKNLTGWSDRTWFLFGIALFVSCGIFIYIIYRLTLVKGGSKDNNGKEN